VSEGYSREQFDRIKAAAEGYGYTVVSKWRPGLKTIRLGDIVLSEPPSHVLPAETQREDPKMGTITDRAALDTAPERRKSGYAARFVNETDEPPTDANLARVLPGRVHPEDYHDIRRYVRVWRQLRARQVTRFDALSAVSLDPPMARAFDAQWDGGADCATVGDQIAACDALAVEVLRAHGYAVR